LSNRHFRRAPWSSEVDAQLRQLLASGASAQEAGRVLGVTRDSVTRRGRLLGLGKAREPRKANAAKIVEPAVPTARVVPRLSDLVRLPSLEQAPEGLATLELQRLRS
jgi:hypothetical protein